MGDSETNAMGGPPEWVVGCWSDVSKRRRIHDPKPINAMKQH